MNYGMANAIQNMWLNARILLGILQHGRGWVAVYGLESATPYEHFEMLPNDLGLEKPLLGKS